MPESKQIILDDMTVEHAGYAWVAFTNTDRTEGRGHDVPIGVCKLQATAMRLATGAYVMGSDGPVRRLPLLSVGGMTYGPVYVQTPKDIDVRAQAVMDAKAAAIEKAKAAGLSDEDIKAIAAASLEL